VDPNQGAKTMVRYREVIKALHINTESRLWQVRQGIEINTANTVGAAKLHERLNSTATSQGLAGKSSHPRLTRNGVISRDQSLQNMRNIAEVNEDQQQNNDNHSMSLKDLIERNLNKTPMQNKLDPWNRDQPKTV
jgi:hypothetical protein